MDQIDVKAEGKKILAKQAQRARDTADDQEDVYRYVKKYPRATKQDAAKGEIYDIMGTDPGTEERKTAVRKRMYLEKNLRDKNSGVRSAKKSKGKKSARKRVAGK